MNKPSAKVKYPQLHDPEYMQAAHKAKLTARQIAKQVGCSPPAVHHALVRFGYSTRHSRGEQFALKPGQPQICKCDRSANIEGTCLKCGKLIPGAVEFFERLAA